MIKTLPMGLAEHYFRDRGQVESASHAIRAASLQKSRNVLAAFPKHSTLEKLAEFVDRGPNTFPVAPPTLRHFLSELAFRPFPILDLRTWLQGLLFE